MAFLNCLRTRGTGQNIGLEAFFSNVVHGLVFGMHSSLLCSRIKYIHEFKKIMFVINCKNYPETMGKHMDKLANMAQRASKKYGVRIAIAPQQHLLGMIHGDSVTILAQHVDDMPVGSTTGYVVPELLKSSNVCGSLINHSEHRIPAGQIKGLVTRLRHLDMTSIVCVRNMAEVKKYAKLSPDYIAIEPPELIGSGKAVSTERPDLISDAASVVESAKNKTRLLCGAGIVSGRDVSRAMELGAKGILVASGVIKASNWSKTISEFAKSMV